jgi:hypothetical protein
MPIAGTFSPLGSGRISSIHVQGTDPSELWDALQTPRVKSSVQ